MEKPEANRSEANRFVAWLLRCLRPIDPQAEYLGAATDIADLERRLRVLETHALGAHFVTFNH
jgi:hypothetical protein